MAGGSPTTTSVRTSQAPASAQSRVASSCCKLSKTESPRTLVSFLCSGGLHTQVHNFAPRRTATPLPVLVHTSRRSPTPKLPPPRPPTSVSLHLPTNPQHPHPHRLPRLLTFTRWTRLPPPATSTSPFSCCGTLTHRLAPLSTQV
jgi:hypothetical protein